MSNERIARNAVPIRSAERGAPDAGSAECGWAEAMRRGDDAAFEALFRAYYERLCAFAEGYVHSPEVAEELVENVFVHLWEQRRRCPEGLRGFLYVAVRNHAFKHLARERVVQRTQAAGLQQRKSFGMGQPPAAADDQLYADELAAVVQRTIDQLPPRCREAFLLHRQHQMSYAEIAGHMGLSPRTVENHIARALRALRDSLARWVT